MDEIIGTSAYPFHDEVLVELTCRDGDGDLMVLSYQFEYNGDGTLKPLTPVEPDHHDVVRSTLEEDGYSLGHDLVEP